jgi:ribosomal protein L16/L10AE
MVQPVFFVSRLYPLRPVRNKPYNSHFALRRPDTAIRMESGPGSPRPAHARTPDSVIEESGMIDRTTDSCRLPSPDRAGELVELRVQRGEEG